VPVTAKLSSRFYEKLGEDVTNELVDWINSVDATYRTELREINEQNFARFDARLEQRLAESDGRWERRISELRTDMITGLADVKSGLKWMYAFWAPTALAVIGIGIGVISLVIRR